MRFVLGWQNNAPNNGATYWRWRQHNAAAEVSLYTCGKKVRQTQSMRHNNTISGIISGYNKSEYNGNNNKRQRNLEEGSQKISVFSFLLPPLGSPPACLLLLFGVGWR